MDLGGTDGSRVAKSNGLGGDGMSHEEGVRARHVALSREAIGRDLKSG